MMRSVCAGKKMAYRVVLQETICGVKRRLKVRTSLSFLSVTISIFKVKYCIIFSWFKHLSDLFLLSPTSIYKKEVRLAWKEK